MLDYADRIFLQVELGNMSDAELREIVTNNSIKSFGMKNTAELERIVRESKFCASLVESRAKARNEWKNNLRARKHNAILNLKTAVTPTGQLIAAILEDEDSMTVDELCSWCEELEKMGQGEVQTILDALVSEGVLRKKENTYQLYRVCTESLFPEDPVEWANRVTKLRRGKPIHDECKRILLRVLKWHGKAMDPTDFPKEIEEYEVYLRCEGKLAPVLQEIRKLDNVNVIRRICQEFVLDGILGETDGVYYFTMLGEGKRK